MSHVLPGIGLTGFFGLGFDGWDGSHDVNLRLLSALVQGAVSSRLAAVPGSPVDGDMHILTVAPNLNTIAVRDVGVWYYLTPKEGYGIWVSNEDRYYVYDGAAWLPQTTSGHPYVIGTFFDTAPTASEVLLDATTPIAVTFGALFTGSVGSVLTAPAATFTMKIQKRTSGAFADVGTIAVSTGGVVTFTGTANFAAGDRLRIVAPAATDASIAGFSVALKGIR